MFRFSTVLATFGVAALLAAVPASGAAITPQIEVIRAPARSPIDLVGTGYAWGVRTGKGDALPAGGTLLRGRLAFPAGTARGTAASMTLRCPSGSRVVGVVDLQARPPLRLEDYPSDSLANDRATAGTFRFAARGRLTTPRTGRISLVCFDAARLAPLRARQERAVIRDAARTRPEVRTAPRRTLCRTTYVQAGPGRGGVFGTVFRTQPVLTLRRSPTGRYTEVLGLRAFNGFGWLRTSALCR